MDNGYLTCVMCNFFDYYNVCVFLAGESGDISVSPSTVMLRLGQLQANVTVTGLDDDLYEGAESAELTITSSDSKAVEFSSPSPTINIDIIDNDCELLYLSFCTLTYTPIYKTYTLASIFSHRHT